MGPGPAVGRDLAEVCCGGGEEAKGGDGVSVRILIDLCAEA